MGEGEPSTTARLAAKVRKGFIGVQVGKLYLDTEALDKENPAIGWPGRVDKVWMEVELKGVLEAQYLTTQKVDREQLRLTEEAGRVVDMEEVLPQGKTSTAYDLKLLKTFNVPKGSKQQRKLCEMLDREALEERSRVVFTLMSHTAADEHGHGERVDHYAQGELSLKSIYAAGRDVSKQALVLKTLGAQGIQGATYVAGKVEVWLTILDALQAARQNDERSEAERSQDAKLRAEEAEKERAVAELVAMGFAKDKVEEAMSQSGGNVQVAKDLLLQQEAEARAEAERALADDGGWSWEKAANFKPPLRERVALAVIQRFCRRRHVDRKAGKLIVSKRLDTVKTAVAATGGGGGPAGASSQNLAVELMDERKKIESLLRPTDAMRQRLAHNKQAIIFIQAAMRGAVARKRRGIGLNRRRLDQGEATEDAARFGMADIARLGMDAAKLPGTLMVEEWGRWFEEQRQIAAANTLLLGRPSSPQHDPTHPIVVRLYVNLPQSITGPVAPASRVQRFEERVKGELAALLSISQLRLLVACGVMSRPYATLTITIYPPGSTATTLPAGVQPKEEARCVAL